MMRSVTLRHANGNEIVYATNARDGGLFKRRPTEGAYHQELGNSQTPMFRDRAHFLRWLRRGGALRGSRLVDSIGW